MLLGLLKHRGPETTCLKACGLAAEAVYADLEQIGAETNLLERHALRRMVDGLPKERLDAAALLLAALATEKFEVKGSGVGGPFQFSFGNETE
jgi:hypothetical protein